MRRRYKGLSYGMPLALSDEMISSVYSGHKTHTIRAMSKSERAKWEETNNKGWPCTKTATGPKPIVSPYGEVGDYLWVRESYRVEEGITYYRTVEDPDRKTPSSDWLPVVGMPEECSRMCLLITEIRFAPKIQGLKARDIHRDGFTSTLDSEAPKKERREDMKNHFAQYWNTRYRARDDKWENNPAVWVVEFRLLTAQESKDLKKAKDYLASSRRG